jgi:integrase
MTHVNLPYLMEIRAKGHSYWYVRFKGQRKAITDPSGIKLSPDMVGFLAAYERTKETIGVTQHQAALTGTLAHLIGLYTESHDFKNLADRTRKDYDAILSDLNSTIGDVAVCDFTVEDVTDIMEAHTPHRANYYRAVMSILFGVALQKTRTFGLTFNPAMMAKKVRYTKDPYPAWPDALIEKMRVTAPRSVVLAMELGLHTGQRGGDLVRMTWNDFDRAGRINVVQRKTKKKVWIKCSTDLIAALSETRKNGVTILTTGTGRAWTENWLRKQLSDWSERCGYPGFATHGLRKSSVIRLLLAGNSTKQTAATVGMSDAMVSHYSRDIDAQFLADSAIDKLGSGPINLH